MADPGPSSGRKPFMSPRRVRSLSPYQDSPSLGLILQLSVAQYPLLRHLHSLTTSWLSFRRMLWRSPLREASHIYYSYFI